MQLDPGLARAQVGLAQVLADRVVSFSAGDSAKDLERADHLIASVLATEPSYAEAHATKAILLYAKKQYEQVLSELKIAIEINPNYAQAFNFYGATHFMVGKAAEAIPFIETAFRLSPLDPSRFLWESNICHAYMHLAEWEKAAEWCEKSIARNSDYWIPLVDLVSADGWLHRDSEAETAIAGLLKVRPGFTLQTWANIKWSENPTFQREYRRMVEGLRMAGLPEK